MGMACPALRGCATGCLAIRHLGRMLARAGRWSAPEHVRGFAGGARRTYTSRIVLRTWVDVRARGARRGRRQDRLWRDADIGRASSRLGARPVEQPATSL